MEERTHPRQHPRAGFLLQGFLPHLLLALQHSLLGQLPLPLVGLWPVGPAGTATVPATLHCGSWFKVKTKCGGGNEVDPLFGNYGRCAASGVVWLPVHCGAQCKGHDTLSSGTPRRIKRSAVEQQAASVTLNGLVPLMTQIPNSRQLRLQRRSGTGVALLNLGRRDGEAPIVPSLERVRHRETQLQSSLHYLYYLIHHTAACWAVHSLTEQTWNTTTGDI